MPSKSFKPCSSRGCPSLTRERYCDEHHQLNKQYDKDRGSSAKRGYGSRWRKARIHYLVNNPICVDCGQLATVVDHIIPHKGNYKLFWDRNNWQPMCGSCHSRKTVKKDGGFGNG
jgi:5-methylcytosine-specific restriction enzyme A